jgi:hypothetical protein
MKLNHQTQSVFVMRFGFSLYELCILVSALALSIEFNAALGENVNKIFSSNVGLLDNR